MFFILFNKQKSNCMKIISILFVCAVLLSCSTKKPEIYQWRGKNRWGIFNEKNLLKKWPASGPAELWHIENIGSGYGSPTVTENEIFITGETDSLTTLYCLNLDGKTNWKTALGKAWATTYPGSRSAPTVVDDLVYVITGMGNLFCIKKESGEVVWSKNFKNDADGSYPRFGDAEAPVVDGDRIFWTPGGKENNVVALNRFNGNLIWSCKGFGERPGYNPGNIIELPSRKIFVTFSAYHLMGIDADTGELLWSQLQDNTPPDKRAPGIGDTHSNNIIFENGSIYYAAGDGNCGVKLKLSDDGTQITEVWRNKDFDSFMGGIVKINNTLYGCGTASKELKSIDATSGTITDSLTIGTGALIAADQMLYYYNQRGQLSLVKYNEGNLAQVSMFKIKRGTREHFSHPVIKNGILYQRHGNALMAFDIRENT